MLDSLIDLEFHIQPGRALLLLEAENLLSKIPSENSDLRRNFEHSTREHKIIWDTRRLPTEDTSTPVLFIALKTQRFDTHSEVASLLNQGCIVIAQEDLLRSTPNHGQAFADDQWQKELLSHPNLICVHSTELAKNLLLETVCRLNFKEWTTLAITGTNGKTSSTQITSSMLEKLSQRDVLRLGTLGIQIAGRMYDNPFPTQPDYAGLLGAMRMASSHFACNQLVMEATSIGIAEGRLGRWPVQCAAFLNLTQDHLDYHGTMDKYLEAKLDLFRRHLSPSGQLAVNCDDGVWEKVIAAAAGKKRYCVGFGSPAHRADFLAKSAGVFGDIRYLEVSHRRSTVNGIAGQWTLWLDAQTSMGQCQYSFQLLGEVQHENVTAAAAMMIALGYPLNQIAAICPHVEAIRGRLELVTTADSFGKPNVLVDYAHSPDALEKTLNTCKELLGPQGQLICVFGCGGDRDPTKRPLMGRIASRIAHKVWITSDNPRTENPQSIVENIVAGIPTDHSGRVAIEVDRKTAIFKAIQEATEKDIVLIAGKGHEDYQIVGSAKFPFSDCEVARQALSGKRNI
jgi:UDP-N-acetylmuramoyl-L-alanyl-D-glutamate--2,6-diaminopimelate ligase